MANLKSAKKRVNTNQSKRERNVAVKSNMRLNIKKVEKFIDANEEDEDKNAYHHTNRKIDKYVSNGEMHYNKEKRQKIKKTSRHNRRDRFNIYEQIFEPNWLHPL